MHEKTYFDSIPEALEDIAKGKMVIVVDDEDRENEGDFVMAADKITPEAVNFMATHGKGLICTPLPLAWAKRLELAPMISNNNSAYETAFTISIDAIENTTTGISASDRYHTIKKLSEPFTKAQEFAKPGHIFPLIAKDGGVLERNGHTEAGVDLARLAGCQPVSVICEIINDDGSMARRDDLLIMAKTFDMKIITIKDLIRYRRLMENGFECETTIPFPNKYGKDFELSLYIDRFTGKEYTAITKNIYDGCEPLVRIHSQCFASDLFGAFRSHSHNQLDSSMKDIAQAESGVFIYLEQEGRGIGLANKIREHKLQDKGLNFAQENSQLSPQLREEVDLRDFTPAAMILNELGVKKLRLLSRNPQKAQILQEYGIETKANNRFTSVQTPAHAQAQTRSINLETLIQ